MISTKPANISLRFRCPTCKKLYTRESLFHKHFDACKTKKSFKSTTALFQTKEQINSVSLNVKLNQVLEILDVQSERIKHMEKMLESKNKIIKNKLQWLIKNATPEHTFQECLSNIQLNRYHYDYITKHGYLKGYCDIAEEIIDSYEEIIYSFTTSSITYVYINPNEKWVEFNKTHAFQIFCKIQQQLINVALTVDIPDRMQLVNNSIIYGTHSQSIDIKT